MSASGDVYLARWQDTVEVIEDAGGEDLPVILEKYRRKDGQYMVRDLINENSTIEVVQLSETDETVHVDDDAPDCGHCGSTLTYYRLSDGDVGCNECPGIMPNQEVDA